MWADLIVKLKDGVLSAFDSAVVTREEDVKKMDSQRQMPGWNFCQYTILKVRERGMSVPSSHRDAGQPGDVF